MDHKCLMRQAPLATTGVIGRLRVRNVGTPGASLDNAAPLPSRSTSPAREREAAMLARCVAIARGEMEALQAADAPILALAASLLQHRLPDAAQALTTAAEKVRSTHFAPPLPLTELLRSGLIVDLPRFKSRLLQRLTAS